MVRLKRLFAGFTIIVAPIIYFGLLFTTYGLGAFEDELIQYFPNIHWLGEQLGSGVFPFWNPLVYGGYPQVSDPQSGVLYPINWLAVVLPERAAYPLLILIHYWIAGWGMYRLGRQWDFTRGVSTFGAVAWMFCGFMLGHRTHYTILAAASWMSVIFYLWTRIATQERPRAYFVIIVFCQAMQILAGQIQVAAMSGAAVGFYLLITLEKNRLKMLCSFGLGCLLTIGLAAVELIPVWTLYANSVRSANSFRFITENSFLPVVWPMLFAPASFGLRVPNFLYGYSYFGPWNHCELNCFTTLTALALAAFAVRNAWRNPARRRLVVFGVILGGLAIFLAMGRYNPAFKVLYEIPIFRPFRCPARYLLWFNFAVAILAMVGMQNLLHREYSEYFRRFARRLTVGLMGVFILFFILLAIAARLPIVAKKVPESLAYIPQGIIHAVQPINPAIILPLFMAAGLIACCRIVAFRRLPRVLMVLMIVEIGLFAPFYDFHFEKMGKVDLKPPVAKMLDEISTKREGFVWPVSCDSYVDPLSRLEPFTNMLVGRSTITGYGPLLNKYHRRIFGWELWPTTTRYLEILSRAELMSRYNIRYIVADASISAKIDYLKTILVPVQIDPKLMSLDENPTIVEGSRQSWSVPSEQGLYKVRFDVRGLSEDDLRLILSIGPLASTIWKDQNYSLTTWDIGKDWRTFEWYYFIPKEMPAGQAWLNFNAEQGRCEIRGMNLSRVPLQMEHLVYCGVDSASGAKVYENVSWRGRAFFAKGVRPVAWTADFSGRRMKSAENVLLSDSLDTTWITAMDELKLPNTVGHGKVTRVEEYTNSINLQVEVSGRPALLVIPGGFDIRWRVLIDGFESPLLCADGISRATVVSPGEHDITLIYVPDSFIAGVAVAAFTVLVMIFILASGLAQQKEKPGIAFAELNEKS
jgi:hypothetical protein